MTVFIDTSIIMYAAGADHPLSEPCRRILDGISAGSISAATSAEVVQEIIHRFIAVRRGQDGADLATKTMDLFAPVLPITHALIRRVPGLARRYPALDARDLIHVATCIHEGITDIVTSDKAFESVDEVNRIDPLGYGA